ncbi:hypothetical protein DVH24_032775 [Malus domestica]|uniref:Uncharacterized protein n=1 Tax=Malus domestica TaxID=3750 RepID=A0A498ISR4_MALDO|nr:hypothetical protein DVH24_032775 [Malus domestica]
MAETTTLPGATQPSKLWKGVFAVAGIMTTLVTYGVLQEKIMRVPYGDDKAFFKYSLFLVFCNRIMTSAVSAVALLARKKALDPVAPVYKYCLVSISNILTTTCQYEALKYVSFPVQTLAKCAKMIPVMVRKYMSSKCLNVWKLGLRCDLLVKRLIEKLKYLFHEGHMILCSLVCQFMGLFFMQVWGTIIMQKKYRGPDYFLAFLVTVGCSIFILYPVWSDSLSNSLKFSTEAGSADIGPSDIYGRGRENTIWGISLMVGYLGFDGFTSTFQDKLFKGYDMEIHNQIFYTTFCSCVLSLTGLLLQGQLLPAIHFVSSHNDCFFDIALLSTVATASQFFISYTIRTFGALTFATIMTTRQVVVFGSLYAKSFMRTKPSPSQQTQNGASSPVKGIP